MRCLARTVALEVAPEIGEPFKSLWVFTAHVRLCADCR